MPTTAPRPSRGASGAAKLTFEAMEIDMSVDSSRELDRVRILKDDDTCPDLPIVEHGGSAWAVVWPGVGARLRSMHHISLEPGGRTVTLTHPMEAVYYVIAGKATVSDPNDASHQPLVPGSMAHIDPGTSYLFEAGSSGAEIIGGPCPVDPQMYSHLNAQ